MIERARQIPSIPKNLHASYSRFELPRLSSEDVFPMAWIRAIVPQAFPNDSICLMK